MSAPSSLGRKMLYAGSCAAVALIALWLMRAVPHRAPPLSEATRAGACAGRREDPARTERLRALLASLPRGRSLLGRARGPLRVCYAGAGSESFTAGDDLVLVEGVTDAENAARLGHLLLHRVEGTPEPETAAQTTACAALVREAIMAEARAHALELELRHDLQVTHPRRVFPFARAYWDAPAADRLEVLRRHFWAHPEGGAGVPGFVQQVARRCAARRSRTLDGADR